MKPLAKRLRAVSPPSGPKRTRRSHAYSAGLQEGLREGRRAGVADGRKQMRDEMTFELGVAEGETVIGHVPEQPFIRVAVHPQMYRPAVGMEDITRFAPWADARTTMLTFRAVKMAWSSGNGDRFVWFTWERSR